jgi:hypothetical protein
MTRDETELIESLREAIAEMDAGKGIPLEILKAELDERYGGQFKPKAEEPPTPTR